MRRRWNANEINFTCNYLLQNFFTRLPYLEIIVYMVSRINLLPLIFERNFGNFQLIFVVKVLVAFYIKIKKLL